MHYARRHKIRRQQYHGFALVSCHCTSSRILPRGLCRGAAEHKLQFRQTLASNQQGNLVVQCVISLEDNQISGFFGGAFLSLLNSLIPRFCESLYPRLLVLFTKWGKEHVLRG